MNKILFYSRGTDYGWLSNFHRAWQRIDGIYYKTNEHYYQSQKAKFIQDRDYIRNAPRPHHAMVMGRGLRPKDMVEDWDTKKFEVMLNGLRAKFSQNEDLKERLLDTGEATLHEDSPTDMVWGVKGKDMLGKLLMQVRDELRKGGDPIASTGTR